MIPTAASAAPGLLFASWIGSEAPTVRPLREEVQTRSVLPEVPRTIAIGDGRACGHGKGANPERELLRNAKHRAKKAVIPFSLTIEVFVAEPVVSI
jgi:hypothetical protein